MGHTFADLGVGSVTSAQILDGTVQSIDIRDGDITTLDIMNRTILATDIGIGQVTSAEILDGTVQSIDIRDNDVTTLDIYDQTLTNADILDEVRVAQNASTFSAQVSTLRIAQAITVPSSGSVLVTYTGAVQFTSAADATTRVGIDTNDADDDFDHYVDIRQRVIAGETRIVPYCVQHVYAVAAAGTFTVNARSQFTLGAGMTYILAVDKVTLVFIPTQN